MYALIGKFTATAGNQSALGERLLSAAQKWSRRRAACNIWSISTMAMGYGSRRFGNRRRIMTPHSTCQACANSSAKPCRLIGGMDQFPLELLGGHGGSS